MATCSAIATRLDEEMLAHRPAFVHPSHTPFSAMPSRPGRDIAVELGGRYLLRYLLRKQYRQFTTGSSSPRFVTPTPYSPTEVISWLALPTPARREFVLFLDAVRLSDVRGPRRVHRKGAPHRGTERTPAVPALAKPAMKSLRWANRVWALRSAAKRSRS